MRCFMNRSFLFIVPTNRCLDRFDDRLFAEELSLTKGETLENVGKISDEWWKGELSCFVVSKYRAVIFF